MAYRHSKVKYSSKSSSAVPSLAPATYTTSSRREVGLISPRLLAAGQLAVPLVSSTSARSKSSSATRVVTKEYTTGPQVVTTVTTEQRTVPQPAPLVTVRTHEERLPGGAHSVTTVTERTGGAFPMQHMIMGPSGRHTMEMTREVHGVPVVTHTTHRGPVVTHTTHGAPVVTHGGYYGHGGGHYAHAAMVPPSLLRNDPLLSPRIQGGHHHVIGGSTAKYNQQSYEYHQHSASGGYVSGGVSGGIGIAHPFPNHPLPGAQWGVFHNVEGSGGAAPFAAMAASVDIPLNGQQQQQQIRTQQQQPKQSGDQQQQQQPKQSGAQQQQQQPKQSGAQQQSDISGAAVDMTFAPSFGASEPQQNEVSGAAVDMTFAPSFGASEPQDTTSDKQVDTPE